MKAYRPHQPLPQLRPDYMRQAMIEQLAPGKGRPMYFDFAVQERTEAAMSLDDPSVRWEESRSPFKKVATLVIDPQDFANPERDEFCENISMNPWHSVADHEPVGIVNRARRMVYPAISKLRHVLNGTKQFEPSLENWKQ